MQLEESEIRKKEKEAELFPLLNIKPDTGWVFISESGTIHYTWSPSRYASKIRVTAKKIEDGYELVNSAGDINRLEQELFEGPRHHNNGGWVFICGDYIHWSTNLTAEDCKRIVLETADKINNLSK